MTREMTNESLWIVEMDISRIKAEFPALALLFDNRFIKFYQDNAMCMRILHKNLHEIQLKHIEHDEKEQPVYADSEEGKPTDWKYLPGSDKEAYMVDYKEFMHRSVKVHI